MSTTLIIKIALVSLFGAALVFYTLFGRQAKEQDNEHIIWQKPPVEEHEKPIGE
jgi:hypothetical protein